jgi:hypothetical protein
MEEPCDSEQCEECLADDECLCEECSHTDFEEEKWN